MRRTKSVHLFNEIKGSSFNGYVGRPVGAMDEIDRISFLFSVLLENGEKHKNLACVLGQLWVKKVRPYWIIAVFHNKQVWAFRAETVDKEET